MNVRNRIFAVITAAVLSVGAFSQPVQQLVGAGVVAEAASKVAAPTASKKSAAYYCTGTFKVNLSCSTSGATIYYSVDNGKTYKQYTKTLNFVRSGTIKFYAQKNGVKSAVVTRTYKLVPKFTVSLASGTYDDAQKVYISTSVSGVRFYYTLDGTTPTTASKRYTSKGIDIKESSTLKIRPYKSGWSSTVITKKYTINNPVEQAAQASGESIVENYRIKYGYNTLTAKQKQLYALLYEGVEVCASSIDIRSVGATALDLDKAFYAMDYENPQFFWLKSGYSYTYYGDTVYTVAPQYGRSASQAAKLLPKVEAAADRIAQGALKQDNLFESVKYIHDELIDMTDYTLTGGEYIRDADGALLNGKALCEGYSKAFAYVCQLIGIEANCVIGTASGGAHMWNFVKLDGEWYHMDVTFDDPVGAAPVCEYTYFGLTTAEILKDHTIDGNPYTIPKCTATDYNYYNASGITVYEDASKAYSAIISQAAKNYSAGVMRTEIVCTDPCIDKLYAMVHNKGSDVYADLADLGCKPKGFSYGYNGTTFYVQLS